MTSYKVVSRAPRVGDEVLIMDDIGHVTGLKLDQRGQIDQVLVEFNGNEYSISPFETPVEVIEWDKA